MILGSSDFVLLCCLKPSPDTCGLLLLVLRIISIKRPVALGAIGRIVILGIKPRSIIVVEVEIELLVLLVDIEVEELVLIEVEFEVLEVE